MSKIESNISQKQPELVISPYELMNEYLYGIPVCNQNGVKLTNKTITNKILIAQESIENTLFVKFNEQIINETSDFRKTEFDRWGFVKTSYPVKKPLALDGYYNQIQQIGYQMEWLTSRKEQSSLNGDKESVYSRQIHLVPSGTTGNATSNGIVYNGVMPFALFLGIGYIPDYWHSTYLTGFDKIPYALIDVIAKLSAIQLLAMLGDIYMGIGMSSYSISLDGLSQNTSLLKNSDNGVYSSRIKQFYSDLFGKDGLIDELKAKYKGINFDVL